jgi:hypothetical protein
MQETHTNTLRPPVPERSGEVDEIVPGMGNGKGKEGGNFLEGWGERSARSGHASGRRSRLLAGVVQGIGMPGNPARFLT